MPAGQTFALTYVAEQLEEQFYPRRAAVLASALPGVQFGTEEQRTLRLSPFDVKDPQREGMQMQVQAPFINGSALCMRNTSRTITPGATLENYSFPALQIATPYNNQYVWEAFEASWRHFPDSTVKVAFTLHADKYPAARSSGTHLHICRSLIRSINRTDLECVAAQRTQAGADVVAEAVLPLQAMDGSGLVYDFFLIANTRRGHVSEYPWNPLP
ncbi:hypothetical protein EBQ25_04810 [Allofranklinella schreckenbergeri]|uniref:Uncharacterized protein n=1 Tax=Allofranklinella schreckenbergeri TaxID=1076744 RepID=A0A3M6QBL0_9BURK|nr:hypothetical protein [Allofranklinella schreckenbergeri]RMX00397.1 hypothetical protein EBQ25_04810 [Allofranklinella schreckenbergeri]